MRLDIMEKKGFDKNMQVSHTCDENIKYHTVDDCENFVLEGLPFRKKGEPFRRIPEKDWLFPFSEGVDTYANHTAGVCLRFATDASDIRVRAKVKTTWNSGDIMTLGRTGFDLYCGKPQESFCVGVSKINFDEIVSEEYTVSACLYNRPNPNKVLHEFQLNFPLYAEVLEFAIGFEENSVIEKPSPRSDARPLVLYGTSIEHGCSASRPGMAYANMLSRKLNREVINLGFAGSGKGEEFMAQILAKIPNPGAYILWYDSNVSPQELAETLPAFTDILRSMHKLTPIVTISKLPYPDETAVDKFDDANFEDRKARTDIHKANMVRRINSGDARIHFIDGRKMLGDNPEDCFQDLIHPNDLGMARIAENLAPRLAILTK